MGRHTGGLWIVAAALAAVLLAAGAASAATCYGYDNCRACKNCRYCSHCAKRGGTCGVCKRLHVPDNRTRRPQSKQVEPARRLRPPARG